MWLRCEFSSFHKKSIGSFFVYLCWTFICFVVPAGSSFSAPLTLKTFNIRTNQQCFVFFLWLFTFSLFHSLQVRLTSVMLSLPPDFLSAEVISLLLHSIYHHQRGWILPQYLVSVHFSGTGRVIDLLFCLLMKETTFVQAQRLSC